MRSSIVNSTPLIALAKCGCLDILHKMYDEVMPIIDKMRDNHIYYSEHLIDLVRTKAGE